VVPPLLLEKLIIGAAQSKNWKAATSTLASMVAAGHLASSPVGEAVLHALISLPPPQHVDVRERLEAMEGALHACQELNVPFDALADSLVDAAATATQLGLPSATHAMAVRIVAMCVRALPDPLVLFHRSSSLAQRDARFSVLASGLCGSSHLAPALQRVADVRAVLSPVAVRDCLTDLAEQGRPDQFSVLLTPAHVGALTKAVAYQLLASCRARGDVTTALALLRIFRGTSLGSEDDRFVMILISIFSFSSSS
jgi:hypothetical protein